MLPNNPKVARISELLADLNHWLGRLTPGPYRSDELLFWLEAKIPRDVWEECLATAERKARTLTYEDLLVLLLELALEKEADEHLNAYRLGGQRIGHGRGCQGPCSSGQTSTNTQYMSNTKSPLQK